jgi:mono/diheme cytochrome c family protein
MKFVMKKNREGLGIIALVATIAGCGITAAIIYRPSIAPIERPNAASFPAAVVAKGRTLAAVGDCAVCHTTEGGAIYAGARALTTPFGTLYSTNITPDETTGIGRWSLEAFIRAMRDGVSRSGQHLYPALPYEHFTRVSDEDLNAIYAFLMTRTAVNSTAPPNALIPPLGFRPLLAGWKLLFLHKGAFEPTKRMTRDWNRGAYLVEGLGHCGGCHTPRNIVGGEQRSHAYGGGVAEGWNAPPLDSSNPLAWTWTVGALFNYLRTGIDSKHSAASGPMGPVTHGLSEVPDADVNAISIYVASLMWRPFEPNPSAPPVDKVAQAEREHTAGAQLFAGACAGCHQPGARMMLDDRPGMSSLWALHADDPRNAIQAILLGVRPPVGERGPYMPPFGQILTDTQMADLAGYVRARFTNQPPWENLQRAIADTRKENAQP